MAGALWIGQRADRAGAGMMAFIVLAIVVAIPLLALTAFVQVLYLESLRLRTRDLSSLKFFKESLEERIGLETVRAGKVIESCMSARR